MNSIDDVLKKLEEVIEYKFSDVSLLYTAITHSSYANENKHKNIDSNERLEFLGDAVLDLVISEEIYLNYPHLTEGDMTKVRASIVCSSTLAICAEKLGLGEVLFLGKGEIVTGGRKRSSILSDVFEALIGAVYIDGGHCAVKGFICTSMAKIIDDAMNGIIFLDYKTQLQEIVQSKNIGKMEYYIIDEQGPDHDKLFSARVEINDEISGVGLGKTKKEAEQNAAKYVIENIFKV